MIPSSNPFASVYRVNFLRAKARFDRWDEEMETVRHEMMWCVLYFRNKKKTWLGHVEKSRGKDGHMAYAYKQAKVWEDFEMEALMKFGGKMVQI
jgi:hypothetical protein